MSTARYLRVYTRDGTRVGVVGVLAADGNVRAQRLGCLFFLNNLNKTEYAVMAFLAVRAVDFALAFLCYVV